MTNLTDQELSNARSNIVEVIKSYGIELHEHGKEYRCLCPFHSEKTPSFTVTPSKGRYHCFGCGSNGDAIQFVENFADIDFRAAVSLINNNQIVNDIPKIQKSEIITEKNPQWIPCAVVPADAPDPPNSINRKIDGEWIRHISSERWTYYNEHAEIIGHIHRIECGDNHKEILPQTWCIHQETGECAWRWQSLPKPRPIFGLELLKAKPLADVVIVEGEKTACAARLLFTDRIVISWSGGGLAVKYTDWSTLLGRNIILWPDADQKDYKEPHPLAGQRIPFFEQPGVATMLAIYDLLNKPENCKFVIPPSGVEDGWDLADAYPEDFDPIEHISTALLLSEMKLDGDIKQEIIPEPKKISIEQYDNQINMDQPYFKILGYNHGNYYIFQHKRGQIDSYSISNLTDKGLLSLAPMNWWESNFPAGNNKGVNVTAAVDYILRTAETLGIYDTNKIRGRGAWIDKKRVIFHHGNFLTVDGERTPLSPFPSYYVYEMGKEFPQLPEKELSDAEGAHIFNMASDFRWNNPGSGLLLAGWLALAPVCGALNWRPHIWLQGGPASGKSTIMNQFINPLMNGMAVYFQGGTTEPGIRQALGSDALPVLFDESESSTAKDSLRIQTILSLIRQSSSETEAKTVKGSSGGNAIFYHIRSMFCLSSIQTALTEQADKERVTILTLKPKLQNGEEGAVFWQKILKPLIALTEDETLPGRLIRRSLNQLPNILANIRVFTNAASEYFGAQREGDQYGTLLAGAWSLLSNNVVSKQDALNFIKQYEWDEYRENSDSNDSETAFNTLMSTFIKVPGYQDVPVGDLILTVCGKKVQGLHIKEEESKNILSNYGMRVDENNDLIVCNNHIQLNNLMKHTPFAADLKSVLLRYKGAQKTERKYRFSGIISRVYLLPLTALLTSENEVEL